MGLTEGRKKKSLISGCYRGREGLSLKVLSYRRRRFDDYFGKGATECLLRTVDFSYNCASVALRHCSFGAGTLLGLNHGDDTLALGILGEILGDSVTARSPIVSLKGVNRVVFGDIAV